MLERTAASLESCNLQRVLPKPAAARTTKRSRQLHTGFWQHGASAIEIASIWPTIARVPEFEPVDFTSRQPQSQSQSHTGLVASSFLLDFLYPNATWKLLRRLYPSLPRPQDGKHQSVASRRRHFTSSTATADPASQIHPGYDDASEPSDVPSSERWTKRNQGRHMNQAPERVYPEVVDQSAETSDSIGDLDSETHSQAREFALAQQLHSAALLTDLLSRQDEEHYHDVWDYYCRLDRGQQADFRKDMVLYLSKSHGIVEIGRAISLFRQVALDNWDNDFLAAGILVLMRSGDLEYAIDRLTVGLESKGLTGGLEYVLADTISNQKWPALIGVWLGFYTSRLKFESNSRPDDIPLERLENLPYLDTLYFSFEQFLSTTGVKAVRAINLYENSRLGLSALRRKLAELATMQPCQPKQAATILEMCNDPVLYHDYLIRVLERWEETELKSNVTWLAEIYKTYGDMSDAAPSVPLLRGMFNLFYPNNVAGLEQVYRDWHRAWGGLDQWGYEKFLKFYAGAGDGQAVRDLWKRYVSSYPRVLKRPKAFRSTMNVYAQVGDVAGAEKELRTMTEKYGVQPDLDIWNTLLKCYVRTDNYNRVVACFEEISQMYRPDSYTYAHVMAMSAKKGDLEATLGFFARSQRDRIPVSKEMTMSLVMAYCRNDRLLEAERILTELAERKATSTAIWNQLIYFNGMQGKLNKCYELLQSMKNYDVAWDHQTHEFLLQALVRVDQVQPAYRLLRSACKEKLFPVGPEHFAIVMAGAVRTGEHKLVEIIASQLERAGQSMNFNTQTALVDAAFQKAPSASRTRQLGKEFVTYLQSLLTGSPSKQEKDSISHVASDLRHLRKQTKNIGQAIRLLVELRDFPTAEKLVDLYASIFRKYKDSEPFPPEVVSALMLGYLKDRKYNQIHTMWGRTWESVLARSKRQNVAGVYPAHQYDLSRPITIVAKAFREQKNGKGLLQCIERITSAGFKLTRSNWNLVIQYLAEMGQWEPAMEWCETMLMPRWRGWTPAKKSLQERRHMKNTRVLQASKAAVLSLQHQWLKLRKLSAWSPVVSAKLREIERQYPRLHYAFTTADYDNLTSAWDGSSKMSLTKGAAELLKPFSHSELRVMKRSLEKQLDFERRRKRGQTTTTTMTKNPRAVPVRSKKREQLKKPKVAKVPKAKAKEPMTITIP
ncbi:Pentatricopeptide repeat-containing protein [Cladobotryum mycophilum]|uniref:Pentatricopeptide repeat-containing protein n=1 Tax=Cladobotryum mycophilum TaxID=491253 RepID=A0ABR0T3X5_9HYPO